MIENCHQDNKFEINFNKSPCCLKHLLIMNRMSEEYLLSYEFGKFLLKIFKKIFEKEKNIIKNNSTINENNLKELIIMISKHMSHYYFIDKLKFAKYLCKVLFNICKSQENNKNKLKLNDINSIKNNLSCIYDKEKRYDKAFIIIKELYESNNNINNNDNLIYLNNYINIYIKLNNKKNKEISDKINLLKIIIKQKIEQISKLQNIYDYTNKKNNQNIYSISEIQLYLFIYYNYCNINYKINNNNNNNSKVLSNFKKGYELSMYHLGEKHHLTLKYKIIINKSLFDKNNLRNGHKHRDNYENRKTSLSKYEINSKIDEINNRLEKIGKSITPVKKMISNNNIKKNKSKIQIYAEDISKEEEYSNKNNFINNIKKIPINDKNDFYDYNIEDEQNISKIQKKDLPKVVINLNNDNNDELVCTTLYQDANENDNENEDIENKKQNLPKVVVNLNNDNNDELVCTTLYQDANDNDNNENEDIENKKQNLPKVVVNLNNDNNDELVCTTLYQDANDKNNENEDIENKKQNLPKVIINLNNDNNDNLECTTLYQKASDYEDDNKNEFLDEIENKINKNKTSLPKINVCLDQTNNDDYICETFFLSADEPKKDENNKKEQKVVNSNSIDTKNNESNNSKNQLSFSFNIIKADNNSNDNIIIINEYENNFENNNIKTNLNNKLNNEQILKKYFIDIKFYRPLDIKTVPKEEIFDISKFINNIKDKKSENKYDYKIRIIDEKKYLIKLEMLSNDSVKIILLDKDNNNELTSSKYSYIKILNLYKIIRHDLCLCNMQSYYNFNTYDDYITNTFLNFITVNKTKDTFKFKMAKKPLGLCHCNIVIQLHFCKCVFDIIVISKNYSKIIFSSENEDFNSMCIDAYFDDQSFNMLIDTELIDNKKYVYSFKNNDLNNNELLLELIKKLQKCINSYCSGIVNIFDDIYPKTNPNQKKFKELLIFKININNKLNDVKLYVCEFGNRLCKVVSVDQNLVKLKGIIYSCEINDLFGYETTEIWTKLYSFQKLIFGQLILNSIYFNESNSRICINKYEIIDELNFVNDMRVCNFSLIKLNEKVLYIKFTVYMSVGTWEYSKIIFINSKKTNINKIKLKNIKKQLVNELNIVSQSFSKGEDSFFAYIDID